MEVLEMTEKEMMQKNVEEFERLQDYMISCEKDSEAYKKMKRRYTALKVILTSIHLLCRCSNLYGECPVFGHSLA